MVIILWIFHKLWISMDIKIELWIFMDITTETTMIYKCLAPGASGCDAETQRSACGRCAGGGDSAAKMG